MTRRSSGWVAAGLALGVVLGITIAFPAHSEESLRPDEGPMIVSLVRLIAVPSEYHEKRVVTFGYLEFALEHQVLYLSKGDAEAGILANSICLSVGSEAADRVSALSGRYVEIDGTFDANALRGPGWQHFAGLVRARAVRAVPLMPGTEPE